MLSETVSFADLGLIVIDEQHRFGVEQRAVLQGRAALMPHLLVMTATPIPRSIAMIVFGDLEVSTLREIPAGRQDVQTTIVHALVRPAWLERAWQRAAKFTILRKFSTGRIPGTIGTPIPAATQASRKRRKS